MMILTIGDVSNPNDSSPKIKEIAKIVATYEKLFSNCEIEYVHDYRLIDQTYSSPRSAITSHGEERIVRQGRYFYRLAKSKGKVVEGGIGGFYTNSCFDGEKMVGYVVDPTVPGGVGSTTISDTYPRVQTAEYLTPYRLPLSIQKVTPPLSDYLLGSESITNDPMFLGISVHPKYIGTEEIDGLKCEKFEMEIRKKQKPNVSIKHLLWLAIERNYLPIRFEDFNMMDDKQAPVSIAKSEDIREIEPGVWCPHKVVMLFYEHAPYNESKKIVLEAERVYTLKFLDFKPNHPKEFFQSVKIPEGSEVYIRKSGQTVDRYIKGLAKPIPIEPRKSTWKWVIGGIAIAFACVIAASVYLRNRKRSSFA
jgi:hypothetical protein